jgi:hypothetical protein
MSQCIDVDVTIEGHGSIILFRLHTETAREWVDENVQEPIWFGDALACESSYADNLAAGMAEGGLTLGDGDAFVFNHEGGDDADQIID